MQQELAAAGHTIGVNSLTVLLREEGFSRLPAAPTTNAQLWRSWGSPTSPM
jgi:hypothetical protein